jgi:periplasmic divalent cation tolerance protein
MDRYLVALCTVGKAEDAHAIARMLVEKRLAACVNVVGGVSSHYRWKGAMEIGEEWLLVMKTSQDRFEALRQAIVSAHSYEVPEIIALPIIAGHPPYLDWIAESLK